MRSLHGVYYVHITHIRSLYLSHTLSHTHKHMQVDRRRKGDCCAHALLWLILLSGAGADPRTGGA